MSLRVRSSGRILCAAKCDPLPDDIYIDDAVHCWLSGCDGLMEKVIKSLGEDETGQEEWVFINDKRYPKD